MPYLLLLLLRLYRVFDRLLWLEKVEIMFSRLITAQRLAVTARYIRPHSAVRSAQFLSTFELAPNDPKRNLDTHPTAESEELTLEKYPSVTNIPWADGHKKLNAKWNLHLAINIFMTVLVSAIGMKWFKLGIPIWYWPLPTEDADCLVEPYDWKCNPDTMFRKYKEPAE